ncbi:hypothetical protein GF406_08355 [candidate division KSB1 bacterium]|nr:hypothetical protein [candidate division KSB1 bacterium]
MITQIKIGDILASSAQTLINTVNCVGVMGKGIAAEFKTQFPDMFKDYKERCENGLVKPGIPYLYKRLLPPWIINFPTKDHWRSVSKMHDIKKGLSIIVEKYKEWGIQSLAVPPLGCGNGQLLWENVGPLIYQYLDTIDIPVELYAPYGTPKEMLTKEFLTNKVRSSDKEHHQNLGKLNIAWLPLVEILYELEKHPYKSQIGRTFFQKIAYVVTEQNVPTQFRFEQSSYGPFSIQIKPAISILANNGLIKEEKNGQMLKLSVGPQYEYYREKHRDKIEHYRKIINRTADLFSRMDTQQAELATTIFFSSRQVKKEKTASVSECDIFDYVKEWKKRRRPPIEDEKIASAIRNLAMLKWLNVEYCPGLPVPDEF